MMPYNNLWTIYTLVEILGEALELAERILAE